MVVEVAVAEDAPTGAGEAAEGGMVGPYAADVAAADRLHEPGELARFRFPVRRRPGNELGRGRRSFGKRKPVDDELLERRVAQRESPGLGRKLTKAHPDAVGAVRDHLRNGHLSPARRAILRQPADALLDLPARLLLRERFHFW